MKAGDGTEAASASHRELIMRKKGHSSHLHLRVLSFFI